MTDKNVLIFCSASYTIDPAYNEAARSLVRALCAKGYGIVSGGTVKGTMGVVSEEVVSCGGEHRGVIPRFMKDLVYPNLTEVVWTDTMSERKEAMREGTCAAVALPGGIGTLDELAETLTLAKLNKYTGKVMALNMNGFYEPLKALLDHYVKTEMLDEASRKLITFPETVEDLVKELDLR